MPRSLIGMLAATLALGMVLTAEAQTARQWAAERSVMVESEVAAAGIKRPAILAVMRTVPRHEFVPADLRPYAYLDMALPIGEHQTISPPFIVAWMTQQLDPQPTDRVLEIGTGSGYQAAILSGLVKEVYTIEIIEPLAAQAISTFQRLGYKNVEVKLGDGYQGWPEHAPFDKIIVTCSPEKVPGPLVEQLREGGRIVVPLGERFQQTLYSLVKRRGKLVVESREATFFVPMSGQAESLRSNQDQPVSELVNGDFEDLLEPDKPAGWYYLRQAAIAAGGPGSAAGRAITFTNRVPGRSSQALQALGIDGRHASYLAVDLWVQAREVAAGQGSEQAAGMVVHFFDENRVQVGQQVVGPWQGTFDWQRKSGHLKVPPAARVAIVALGLLGTTGELSCDQVSIRVVNPRTAQR
jgi:protein-L-isoaspartate(D-aspartate) O-methyltransferase